MFRLHLCKVQVSSLALLISLQWSFRYDIIRLIFSDKSSFSSNIDCTRNQIRQATRPIAVSFDCVNEMSERRDVSKIGRIATVTALPLTGGGWQLQVNGIREEEYEDLTKKIIGVGPEKMYFHSGFVTAEWRLSKTLSKETSKFPPMAQTTVILNSLSLWGFELQNKNKAQLLRPAGDDSGVTGYLWTLRKFLD